MFCGHSILFIFLSFSKDGIVDVASIDRILQHMGMKLAEMEREDLIEKLPVDGEHVNLNVCENLRMHASM